MTGVVRRRLGNGLRVIVQPVPGCARVAVSVHYGVGFRNEPPGLEGFAHLVEHLMFRGSEHVARGTFHERVTAVAGRLGGHTHQDYTEYFELVPADALDQALFLEADRMRAPVFTAESIDEQLAGVAEEIRGTTVERPFGGFPWPALPSAMFTTHANAHDGYGDAARLAHLTPADCYTFFDTHYAPSNAVLTLVGGIEVDRALALADEYFGDVRDRPVDRVDTRDPGPQRDRMTSCTEPGVDRTAVAVGLVLPDPARRLRQYLAHRVLATVATRHLALPPSWPALDVGCGFFEALDARAPDAMVAAALLADGVEPERFVERVASGLRTLGAAAGLDRIVRTAVAGLVTEHRRRYADPEARARGLGRLEILFDRAELLDELPALLGAMDPVDVRVAAAAAASAPKAVVAIRPGARRTRPGYRSDDPGRSAGVRRSWPDRPSWGTAGRSAPEPRALRMPPSAGAGSPPVGHGGLQILADPRAELVQVCVYWPAGAGGVAAVGRAQAVLHRLPIAAGCPEQLEPHGATLTLRATGRWVGLTGEVPAAALADWTDALARVLRTAVPAVLDGPDPPLDPFVLGEAAWLTRDLGTAPAVPLALSELVGPGPIGVVVAAADPETVTACLRAGLGPAGFDVGRAAPPVATPQPAPRFLAVERPLAADHLMVRWDQPGEPADHPAFLIANAVLGGNPTASRLASRARDRGSDAYPVFFGCEPVPGGRRYQARAVVRPGRMRHPPADLTEELGRMRAEPPSPTEVAAARRYVCADLLSVFDSPAVQAELLTRLACRGMTVEDVRALPARVAEVPDRDVVEACAELATGGPLSAVVVGPAAQADLAAAFRAVG